MVTRDCSTVLDRTKKQFSQFDGLICFGGEDWWYKNRGHFDIQLMRRFAQFSTILYINSIVMQKPNLKKSIGGGKNFSQKLLRKSKSILMGLKQVSTNFWVYSPFSLPVHHIAGLRPVNEAVLRLQLRIVMQKLGIYDPMVWVACPAACDIAIKMKKAKLFYQRTDRFEEYPNVDSEAIRQYDQKLKASADLTIFVNKKLYTEESNQCQKAFYLDHGVDYELFAEAEQNSYIPNDIANVPNPIVGFFGAIDHHTSDMPFIEKVVDLLPQISFVFVGEASSDVTSLQKRKNVWLLGKKLYEQIPHYGKCFDVAIMPWQQNRWIEACNPIKLKEYLALGKPIVSTPFAELEKYRDVVYEAKTPTKFAECIKEALAKKEPHRVFARRKKVQTATWDSKARLVWQQLIGENHNSPTGKSMAKQRKNLRICLAASGGGHMSQLLKLAESWKGYDTFCVTTTEVVREKVQQYGKVYIIGECNREHPLRVILVLIRCMNVILCERPDVVISTGAAPCCIACFIGKITGSKVVWIDSITNIERLSLSGRMLCHIADLFLVQWSELAKRYKSVEYVGAII
jgi:glycosyltransferase involved in cell wall biosynthesis